MKAITTKLVVFTVFTIIVTFWLASVIGKLSPFQATYEVEAVFSDATGVLNGDPVKIAGVNVGKVTQFRVEEGEAIVRMEIDGDVDIPDNSFFNMNFLNLLGQRVIYIERAEDPSSAKLDDGDQVPVTQTSPALDLSVVFNNLRPLIQTTDPEDINTVARAVLKIFKGREGDLAGTLGNLGRLTDQLAQRDGRLARLVTDLNDLAKVLNGRSGSIRTSLSQFTSFMEKLAEVTPRVERVVDQLNTASTKFGGVVSRNRGNLDQELSDLKVLLDIVNDELGPLDRVAKNLKEVLLATARSQSYGRWWNLYVVNFCPETGAFGAQAPEGLDCRR